MISIDVTTSCFGCGVCEVVCNVGAIKLKESSDGFFIPQTDPELCTDCGLCDKICPFLDQSKFDIDSSTIKSLSIYSKDKSVLSSCTSGGVAYHLSREAINQKFSVVGVTYDYEQDIAKHITVDNINDLELLKGSKYVQSYSVDAFRSIFLRKNKEKKYLIVGTPCQIAGVRNLAKLKRVDTNHIYVDFFCHGVPSYNLWNKYVAYQKNKHGLSALSRVLFRDKRNGWHSFTLSFKDNSKEITSELDKNDFFYKFFLHNKCLNKACYESCKFKNLNSVADIRIGDLWGSKYAQNNEGVSGVLIYTDKGYNLINSCSNEIVKNIENLSNITESQLKHKLTIPRDWQHVIDDLKSDLSLDFLYKKYIYPLIVISYYKRIIGKIKREIGI